MFDFLSVLTVDTTCPQNSMKEQINNEKVAREVTASIIADATASAAAIDKLHSVWPSIIRSLFTAFHFAGMTCIVCLVDEWELETWW
jgi:hypothetical protein